MPFDLLQSPAGLDALLMFLLVLWLGGSVAMTILTGIAARRKETALARQASYRARRVSSGQISAVPDIAQP